MTGGELKLYIPYPQSWILLRSMINDGLISPTLENFTAPCWLAMMDVSMIRCRSPTPAQYGTISPFTRYVPHYFSRNTFFCCSIGTFDLVLTIWLYTWTYNLYKVCQVNLEAIGEVTNTAPLQKLMFDPGWTVVAVSLTNNTIYIWYLVIITPAN